MTTTAILDLKPDDAARGSQTRGTVDLANALALLQLNQLFTAGGVTTASTTSKAKLVNTATFTVGGAFQSLGATDNLWVLGATGAATTVAVGSWQKYLLMLDNTPTTPVASVLEGTQSNVSAAAVRWNNIAIGAWGPLVTALNANRTIIAVLTIATDATHTFIPGTTLFGATGITATFADGFDASLLPVIADAGARIIGTF